MQKITKERLLEMQNVDLMTVDKSELVDIRNVKVNKDLDIKERIADYVNQIKNPYCFLCGDVVVKVSYNENGKPLENLLENYLRKKFL
ncbi:MAG: hypothetical protein IJ583_16145 [Firmicutes bacterium]|nr:hypothetical protein [Bacillota bacterium]